MAKIMGIILMICTLGIMIILWFHPEELNLVTKILLCIIMVAANLVGIGLLSMEDKRK